MLVGRSIDREQIQKRAKNLSLNDGNSRRFSILQKKRCNTTRAKEGHREEISVGGSLEFRGRKARHAK